MCNSASMNVIFIMWFHALFNLFVFLLVVVLLLLLDNVNCLFFCFFVWLMINLICNYMLNCNPTS